MSMVIELTNEQESTFVDLAKNREQTTAELAREVFSDYLKAQAAHHQAIERARAQIASGQTTAHEEVFARLKQRKGW
jgi:predicted transcriptional regulator